MGIDALCSAYSRSNGRSDSIVWALVPWILLIVAAPGAAAQASADEKRLKNQTEFSAVDTSGNTDLLTVSLKNTLEYRFSETYIGTWHLSALNGEQDGQRSAERYSTDLRMEKHFKERLYLYLMGGWLRDKFSGLEHRYHLGPGLGVKLLKGPKHMVRTELGMNWTLEDYVVEENEDFLEARGLAQYEYLFSEKNRFLLRMEYLEDLEDGENYKCLWETALISALNQVLAIKIAYEVRYQNRPTPEDLEKVDTILSASLVISY